MENKKIKFALKWVVNFILVSVMSWILIPAYIPVRIFREIGLSGKVSLLCALPLWIWALYTHAQGDASTLYWLISGVCAYFGGLFQWVETVIKILVWGEDVVKD